MLKSTGGFCVSLACIFRLDSASSMPALTSLQCNRVICRIPRLESQHGLGGGLMGLVETCFSSYRWRPFCAPPHSSASLCRLSWTNWVTGLNICENSVQVLNFQNAELEATQPLTEPPFLKADVVFFEFVNYAFFPLLHFSAVRLYYVWGKTEITTANLQTAVCAVWFVSLFFFTLVKCSF